MNKNENILFLIKLGTIINKIKTYLFGDVIFYDYQRDNIDDDKDFEDDYNVEYYFQDSLIFTR